MAMLQIRDLPQDLYFELAEEAKRKHRSLAQQAIISLSKGLNIDKTRQEKRDELIDRLREENKVSLYSALSDPTKHVREDRER